MARNYKVGAEFKVKDGMTRRFSLMERAAARFGRTSERSFKRASRGASKFQSVTAGFLKAQVIGKGMGLLSRGISSVTTSFIEFDKAALGATVRFKDIGPDAANFNDQLKLIQKSARDAGAATEYTAAQSAEALDFLARAGFNSVEAMGSLNSMINLATSSGEDFAQVADMSSDLLGAFGMNSDKASEKIANLNRLNDVLVKSANSANVTIEDMFETMKTAGPVGRIVGASLEEVAAATAILGNAGIKGTEAGTALKNAMLNISAPTPQMLEMMNAIGVSTDDGTGNMKKFSVIIAEVGNAIKDMGNIKQAKVLDTIFGKRAIAGSKNLIDSITQLDKFEETLKNAAGTSQKTADIMRTSIDAKLKALGSAATEAGFKILNAFQKDGKGGIDALTESIRSADMGPFIESLKGLWTVTRSIGSAFFWVGDKIGYAAAKMAQFLENPMVEKVLNFTTTGANQIMGGFGLGDLVSGALGLGPEKVTEVIAPTNPFQSEPKGQQSTTGGFPNTFAPTPEPQRQAPNAAVEQARAQQSQFKGTLNINGAPQGSTVSTERPAAGFNLALQGAN